MDPDPELGERRGPWFIERPSDEEDSDSPPELEGLPAGAAAGVQLSLPAAPCPQPFWRNAAMTSSDEGDSERPYVGRYRPALVTAVERAQSVGAELRAVCSGFSLRELVVVADGFISALLGRSGPRPGWFPTGQTIDQFENGLEFWERNVTTPQASSSSSSSSSSDNPQPADSGKRRKN